MDTEAADGTVPAGLGPKETRGRRRNQMAVASAFKVIQGDPHRVIGDGRPLGTAVMVISALVLSFVAVLACGPGETPATSVARFPDVIEARTDAQADVELSRDERALVESADLAPTAAERIAERRAAAATIIGRRATGLHALGYSQHEVTAALWHVWQAIVEERTARGEYAEHLASVQPMRDAPTAADQAVADVERRRMKAIAEGSQR